MAFDDTITYTGPITQADSRNGEGVNFHNARFIQSGTKAGRPAAGNKGVLYFATDDLDLTYDDGATWQPLDETGSHTHT
jgi:hypothetical protein